MFWAIWTASSRVGTITRALTGFVIAGMQQLVDDGQQESGRFAGAGLCGGDNILSALI